MDIQLNDSKLLLFFTELQYINRNTLYKTPTDNLAFIWNRNLINYQQYQSTLIPFTLNTLSNEQFIDIKLNEELKNLSVLGIAIVQPVMEQQLFQEVIENCKEESIEISKNKYQDFFSFTQEISVSLEDPITLSQINIPCRGTNCAHLATFDLLSFLKLNNFYQKNKIDQEFSSWECPICCGKDRNRIIYLQDIRIDLFLLQNMLNFKERMGKENFKKRVRSFTMKLNQDRSDFIVDVPEKNIPTGNLSSSDDDDDYDEIFSEGEQEKDGMQEETIAFSTTKNNNNNSNIPQQASQSKIIQKALEQINETIDFDFKSMCSGDNYLQKMYEMESQVKQLNIPYQFEIGFSDSEEAVVNLFYKENFARILEQENDETPQKIIENSLQNLMKDKYKWSVFQGFSLFQLYQFSTLVLKINQLYSEDIFANYDGRINPEVQLKIILREINKSPSHLIAMCVIINNWARQFNDKMIITILIASQFYQSLPNIKLIIDMFVMQTYYSRSRQYDSDDIFQNQYQTISFMFGYQNGLFLKAMKFSFRNFIGYIDYLVDRFPQYSLKNIESKFSNNNFNEQNINDEGQINEDQTSILEFYRGILYDYHLDDLVNILTILLPPPKTPISNEIQQKCVINSRIFMKEIILYSIEEQAIEEFQLAFQKWDENGYALSYYQNQSKRIPPYTQSNIVSSNSYEISPTAPATSLSNSISHTETQQQQKILYQNNHTNLQPFSLQSPPPIQSLIPPNRTDINNLNKQPIVFPNPPLTLNPHNKPSNSSFSSLNINQQSLISIKQMKPTSIPNQTTSSSPPIPTKPPINNQIFHSLNQGLNKAQPQQITHFNHPLPQQNTQMTSPPPFYQNVPSINKMNQNPINPNNQFKQLNSMVSQQNLYMNPQNLSTQHPTQIQRKNLQENSIQHSIHNPINQSIPKNMGITFQEKFDRGKMIEQHGDLNLYKPDLNRHNPGINSSNSSISSITRGTINNKSNEKLNPNETSFMDYILSHNEKNKILQDDNFY